MPPHTILVKDWDAPGYISAFLPMFAIYRYPTDFPQHYVVRLFDMDKATPYAMLAATEKDAVALVPPGMVRLERHKNDHPNVVCTYV